MIALIDYGLGNLRSVEKAFEHLGAPVRLASDPREIARAQKLVLPGVGAFAAGMQGLRERGLIEPLKEAVQAGTLLLGICLGMQLLFEESDEVVPGAPAAAGLGLLAGRVERLRGAGLRVPHTGWNQLRPLRPDPLLDGVPTGAYAYFVHSYVCRPSRDVALALTDYGEPFVSVAGAGHVWGIQFHPEKSQQVGLRILQNFVRL